MINKQSTNSVVLITVFLGLFFVFSSFTVREISSSSLRQVERKCKVRTIGTGHDTIGDVKVPNLRFEAKGELSSEQALAQFASIYWEVMNRTLPADQKQTMASTVMPNGLAGASIMVSYSLKISGERSCKPYVSIVFNLDDGRVRVKALNPHTDQFETLTDTTLAELYGLTSAQPAENQQ